jgi:uncharacterized membrane protein
MPNLHPLVIHFPIALLTLGLAAEVWGKVSKGNVERILGAWLQAAGTIGLFAAVATGVLAGQSVAVPEAAREVFESHQQGAFVSAALFAGLGLWRIGARGRIEGIGGVLFLILYAAGVTAILLTGWNGGRLVFEFGVGVVHLGGG